MDITGQAMEPTIDRLVAEQLMAYRDGYVRFIPVKGETFMNDTARARRRFRSRSEKYINRVTNNVVSAIKKQPDSLGSQDLAIRVRAIFDVIQFRTRFIEDVEVRKAKTLGASIAAHRSGIASIFSTTDSLDACTTCKSFIGEPVMLKHVTMDDIAPHHAGCSCSVGFVKIEEQNGETYQGDIIMLDATDIDDPSEYVPDKEYHECPSCGNSAMKNDKAPNTFFCRKCNLAFQIEDKDDNLEDDAKLEKCICNANIKGKK